MRKSREFTFVLVVLMLAAFAPVTAQEVPEPQTLITNVDVWDGTSDSVRKGVDVLVEGSKIKRIAPRISAPGAEKVDGKGGTLIPGLMDTHQHIMLPEGGPTDYRNKFDPYMNAYQAGEAARLMLLRGFVCLR